MYMNKIHPKLSIASAVDWSFRGWDGVQSYVDLERDELRVQLRLRAESFAEHEPDINEVGLRLFEGTDAWKLVQLVNRQRSRLGLRRYGKPRPKWRAR